MRLANTIFGRKSKWNLTVGEREGNPIMNILKTIRNNCDLIITILAPAIFSLIPIYWQTHSGNGKEPYAAFSILLMATYWMTECVPLPVTAFLPVVLFPIFGILPTDKVTPAYLQDSILFMFGGCMIALSFEYCNLHTRIALKVIMVVGAQISQLMLGIMFTTMFLSMWMNNTSTTAMMVPIVHAIMEELRSKMIDSSNEQTVKVEDSKMEISDEMDTHIQTSSNLQLVQGSNRDMTMPTDNHHESAKSDDQKKREEKLNKRIRNLKTMFLLATCYSSNIGGTGVITGSGTNIIVLDIVRKDAEEELASEECKALMQITFLDWMYFNVPPMILNTFITWIYLQIHFLGLPNFLKFWRKKSSANEEENFNRTLENSVKKAIREKYEELGNIRFDEVSLLTLFIVMVFLWVFKDPKFIPGWDSIPIFGKTESGKSFIKECTPTLLICTLMFIIPGKLEYYKNFRQGGLGRGMKDPLLSYKFIEEKFPYGIFLLLGGGSAMALGAKESGLNKWMEEFLENNEMLQSLPGPLILLVVLVLIAIITSVASNTACAAIVTPVLLGMSYVKKMHPLYMVYAASTVCSYAFVLPVSTPPNAIVYSSSDLKLSEMMKPGLLINVICIGVLFLTTHTTSSWIFNFAGYNDECRNMTLLGAESPYH